MDLDSKRKLQLTEAGVSKGTEARLKDLGMVAEEAEAAWSLVGQPLPSHTHHWGRMRVPVGWR